MRLFGKIVKDAKIIKEAFIEKDDLNISYRDLLEACLISLCKELDIQVPLWLKKNTREFVNFRKTFFTREHFVENVRFDSLEIRVE